MIELHCCCVISWTFIKVVGKFIAFSFLKPSTTIVCIHSELAAQPTTTYPLSPPAAIDLRFARCTNFFNTACSTSGTNYQHRTGRICRRNDRSRNGLPSNRLQIRCGRSTRSRPLKPFKSKNCCSKSLRFRGRASSHCRCYLLVGCLHHPAQAQHQGRQKRQKLQLIVPANASNSKNEATIFQV